MDNKKLLFITPKIYPQIVGGTEVFNYYLIQELGKEYDVAFLNVANKSNEFELKNAKRIIIKNTSQIFQLFQIIFYLIKAGKKHDLFWTSFSRTAWYYIIIYPIYEYINVERIFNSNSWRWSYAMEMEISI